MIVDDGGQQVVRAGDRVEVACEVQIDRVRGPQGAFATAGRGAFAAKHRSHRRLAQREGDVLPDLLQTLGQTDGYGRLPLARGSRRDGGDKDQFPTLRLRLQRVEADLGHVASMKNEMIGRNAERVGDGRDVRVHE